MRPCGTADLEGCRAAHGRRHTIPAHVPFLEALAAELVRRPVDVLADTLVLLPSRRACLALRDELARAAGERTLLLPRLQPVGEIEPDELLIDPSAELDLPPALPPLRRHLLLTRLVLAKTAGSRTSRPCGSPAS